AGALSKRAKSVPTAFAKPFRPVFLSAVLGRPSCEIVTTGAAGTRNMSGRGTVCSILPPHTAEYENTAGGCQDGFAVGTVSAGHNWLAEGIGGPLADGPVSTRGAEERTNAQLIRTRWGLDPNVYRFGLVSRLVSPDPPARFGGHPTTSSRFEL